MPYHIKARREDLAERAVACGDPSRAKMLAGLLDGVELVNESRGFLVYTGRRGGTRVSVVSHGVGAPSAAIVFEELAMLGVRTIVRLGSAGGLREVKVGDVVVATGALCKHGGIYSQYFNNFCPPTSPDPELTAQLLRELKSRLEGVSAGPIFSSDAFYAEGKDLEIASSLGVKAVEMECAILMSLGWLRGLRTACVLVVSNLVESKAEPPDLSHRFKEVADVIFDVIVNF